MEVKEAGLQQCLGRSSRAISEEHYRSLARLARPILFAAAAPHAAMGADGAHRRRLVDRLRECRQSADRARQLRGRKKLRSGWPWAPDASGSSASSLVESLLLSACGRILGLVLALWTDRAAAGLLAARYDLAQTLHHARPANSAVHHRGRAAYRDSFRLRSRPAKHQAGRRADA